MVQLGFLLFFCFTFKNLWSKNKKKLNLISLVLLLSLVEKKNYPGEYLVAKTSGLDVHVMNKYSLLRFIDGGNGV
jgi:hypothetical protein